MKQSRRAKRERFINWLLGLGLGSCLFIWTLAAVLQEQVDHYFGYDLQTLRPTEKLVTSFLESVHTNDPDYPKEEFVVDKWVKPIVITFAGNLPKWHQQEITKHAALLQKLTRLRISVATPGDKSASLVVYFVEERKNYVDTARQYMSEATWKESLVKQSRCIAIINTNALKEITSAVNIIPEKGQNSRTRRCLIEELTQAIGPGNDNATYRPSIFSHHYLPDRLSINDKILVRTFYDKRIKPGMTREQTAPLARQIIEELVATVKKRGEEALYQR